MQPVSALNILCAGISVYNIYSLSRPHILTNLLKKIIAIQILNILVQLGDTHLDNGNIYSLIAIIHNIFAKTLMLVAGLIDFINRQ